METSFIERQTFIEPETGLRVIQWTDSPAKDQHLYFTSQSVTADGRWLVFISERTGHPNLFAIERESGLLRQLTDNADGLLRSYVYPSGGRRGLSKASPCLDPVRAAVYFIQDSILCCVDLETGDRRELFQLPGGWWPAYNHISPDGRTLCIPCTDPRAFPEGLETQWEQLKTVPVLMRERKLVTRIFLVDTSTGQASVWNEIPFWVTHVQFDPLHNNRILFNCEGWPDASGRWAPRIWCMEPDGSYRKLFDQPADEFCSHENWAPAGDFIVYHGAGPDKRPYVAARTWKGEAVYQVDMSGCPVVHATPTFDGRGAIFDDREGWVGIVEFHDLAARSRRLCRHDTSFDDQDAHAHPLVTPAGTSVVFTSNKTGTCNVYEVELDPGTGANAVS